jgi:DNA-binding transcriptional MerR regulator
MPDAARDGAGRRMFSRAHVEWLGLIARLRASGMSIRDMQAYAGLVQQGKPKLEESRALLVKHREQVQQRAQP